MILKTYDDDARDDISDENNIRLVLDELQTVLVDIIERLENLENAKD
tara:strand:- start:6908 stop:7048 length:141 start_codon:yes stop_codon:yes gene_type:complete